MFEVRLRKRTPSAICDGIGFLAQHRLTFDKVSSDGSGKCDAESSKYETDRAYGVLFRIRIEEEKALDDAEGLGKGYKKAEVVVATSSQERRAVAYLATKKEPSRVPYHWYKAFVLAGAVEHNLPNAYVEWLRSVPSKDDPDPDRRAENEGLLFGSI